MTDVLVVIDVQQMLVDALDESRRAELLTTIAGLLSQARGANAPVVYVRHGDEELQPGTAGWAIAREIAPQPGEPIVDKRFSDAFRDTDLADVLARLDVGALTVCGMQTDYCVAATVQAARRLGFPVTLIADGHATYPADGQSEAQIRDRVHRTLRDCGATVVGLADVAYPNAGATRAP